MQSPAMQAFMSESDEEHRAAAFSLMESLVLGAAIIGPLLSSVLLPLMGVAGLIGLHGFVMIPATAARAFALRETHHQAPGTALQVRVERVAERTTQRGVVDCGGKCTVCRGAGVVV